MPRKKKDASQDQLMPEQNGGPKYVQIYTHLRQAITDKSYKQGDRLPSENELVDRFSASRPTIGRALAQLESEGFIERRAGSGTYVAERSDTKNLVFGLLITELGVTEIFEPICKGISQAHLGGLHDLLWGPLIQPDAPKEVQAERLCEYYLQRSLSGIFFAPLELSEGKDEVNLRIVRAFDQAHIPIVLLDRDICDYPRRSKYDLVGIDNRRAGFEITEHLLECGARRILFFSRPNSAPTVTLRVLGYREALRAHGNRDSEAPVAYGDPADIAAIRELLASRKPDAIVCANDYTAARLMSTLSTIGVHVPSDVRITGMDDIKYASLLQPPLTTIHQPCSDIGVTALMAMLDRVTHPNAPPRDFLVDFQLIVRNSSGCASPDANHKRKHDRHE
jgi:GntR family transcriptional regulator of arabinose operon